MARGRGSGGARGNPGRGRQSGRSSVAGRVVLPPVVQAAGDDQNQVECCGLCSTSVGDDGVGCDRCDKWFHPSVMCMGIPEGVIQNIKEYGGEGVSYICTACRSSSLAGVNSQGSALGQLLQTVSKLCETVQKLSEKVDGLLSGNTGSAVSQQPNSDQLSALVSEEFREMEERRKRVSSIIIRGVNVRSPSALNPLFENLSTELMGSPVLLSDVVCLNAEKGLFRAKISDGDARRKLLDLAKNLKHSAQYSSVYLNRDLTYKQRQSLIARRTRLRDNDNIDVSGSDSNGRGVGNALGGGVGGAATSNLN